MANTRKSRVPKEEQLKLINECRTSGMTDIDWCREHGIAVSTFYYWVKQLRKEAAQIPAPAYGHSENPRPKQDVVPIDIVPERFPVQHTPYLDKKDLFVIDRKSGINTIAEVNSSWGIKNPFFFQKKVFYWGTKEEQKEIYVLEEGETILSLNKYGDLWEAETIAIPWIHHSQEVEVQHSKYSGIVTVEKTIVRSDDTGAVHMYIYFAGGEKDV